MKEICAWGEGQRKRGILIGGDKKGEDNRLKNSNTMKKKKIGRYGVGGEKKKKNRKARSVVKKEKK